MKMPSKPFSTLCSTRTRAMTHLAPPTVPHPHHTTGAGRGAVLWLTHDHGPGEVRTLDHICIYTYAYVCNVMLCYVMLCMYVCYIYVCVCNICIFFYICIYLSIYLSIYLHMHIYICVCVHMHIYICVYICIYIYVCVCSK